MKISIAGRKGGVGKSSVCCGLASYFSQSKRVLVVDLDPQSNCAFILGGDPTIDGTAALLSGNKPTPQDLSPNLNVLAGGPALGRQDLARLDPEDLADALKLYDGEYEIILFDCPPGSEHLERLAHVSSTKSLVVANAHPLALIGAQRVLEDLLQRKEKGRIGPGTWGLVLNQIDSRRTFDRQVEELLSASLKDVPTFKVRQDRQVSYASAAGVPLFRLDPSCPAAISLEEIGRWLLNENT